MSDIPDLTFEETFPDGHTIRFQVNGFTSEAALKLWRAVNPPKWHHAGFFYEAPEPEAKPIDPFVAIDGEALCEWLHGEIEKRKQAGLEPSTVCSDARLGWVACANAILEKVKNNDFGSR